MLARSQIFFASASALSSASAAASLLPCSSSASTVWSWFVKDSTCAAGALRERLHITAGRFHDGVEAGHEGRVEVFLFFSAEALAGTAYTSMCSGVPSRAHWSTTW